MFNFFSSRSDYEKTNLKNVYSCKTVYMFTLGTERQKIAKNKETEK